MVFYFQTDLNCVSDQLNLGVERVLCPGLEAELAAAVLRQVNQDRRLGSKRLRVICTSINRSSRKRLGSFVNRSIDLVEKDCGHL
jgi:hypothetical protein